MNLTAYTEEEYPFLVNEVMQHITTIKKSQPELSLIDIIYDFCFKYDMDVELVGDAISCDVYFKSFIEKDCQLHKIMKSDKQGEDLGEW